MEEKVSKWWRRFRIKRSPFYNRFFHLEVSYFYLPYWFITNGESEDELKDYLKTEYLKDKTI